MREVKLYIMDKKSAFTNAQGEVDLSGAPVGTINKVASADVVAVFGRGSKIQVLKSRSGILPSGRLSPAKFLRMLINSKV
jgi:hypothetical protein